MNIIIVDSDRGAMQNLHGILEQMTGHKIMDFTDPSTAVAFAEHSPVDVAFIEIETHGFMGLDMVPILRRFNKKINIVLTTKHSKYSMYAFELRASGFVLKPISREQVRDELEHLRYPVVCAL